MLSINLFFIIIIVFILQIIIRPIGITHVPYVISVIWKVLYALNQSLRVMFHFKQLSILIYTKTVYFNTESILDNFKIIRLINEIIDDITDLNDYTVKLIKQLNMKTGKTDYDIAIPWEVCPCHE